MKKLYVIAAVDDSNGIGKDGTIPWKHPEELVYFKRITASATRGKRNAVVMGRGTWDSLPEAYRPLPDRLNIVVTSKPFQDTEDAKCARTLEGAFSYLNRCEDIESIFVIGGESIFQQVFDQFKVDAIYLSRIPGNYQCDRFFVFKGAWRCVAFEDFVSFKASVFVPGEKTRLLIGASKDDKC